MIDTHFNMAPTMIGSMPHKNAADACRLVTRFLPEIPCWPQLCNRSFAEGMTTQFSEGFPGMSIAENRAFIRHGLSFDAQMEQLYSAYLESRADVFPISPEYAAGFHEFIKSDKLKPSCVKGQVTGPLSFGVMLKDEKRQNILQDETLSDAAAKLLRLKVIWQEEQLRRLSSNTIIFVDEPAMSSYGSAFFTISRERVISLLEEVLGGISGLRGIHCCGNTDWSILLNTSARIISFDAYNFAESLALYPAEVKKLLDRGGAIAWGIIPNTEEGLLKESASSLKDRLEEAIAPFTQYGISYNQLKEQALLTPSCGLANLSEDASEKVLELLALLSERMRHTH